MQESQGGNSAPAGLPHAFAMCTTVFEASPDFSGKSSHCFSRTNVSLADVDLVLDNITSRIKIPWTEDKGWVHHGEDSLFFFFPPCYILLPENCECFWKRNGKIMMKDFEYLYKSLSSEEFSPEQVLRYFGIFCWLWGCDAHNLIQWYSWNRHGVIKFCAGINPKKSQHFTEHSFKFSFKKYISLILWVCVGSAMGIKK